MRERISPDDAMGKSKTGASGLNKQRATLIYRDRAGLVGAIMVQDTMQAAVDGPGALQAAARGPRTPRLLRQLQLSGSAALALVLVHLAQAAVVPQTPVSTYKTRRPCPSRIQHSLPTRAPTRARLHTPSLLLWHQLA